MAPRHLKINRKRELIQFSIIEWIYVQAEAITLAIIWLEIVKAGSQGPFLRIRFYSVPKIGPSEHLDPEFGQKMKETDLFHP